VARRGTTRRAARGGLPPVGVVQQQIPGLIDETTGALDFPRVARAFTILSVRTCGRVDHVPSVTRYPGAGVHTRVAQDIHRE